MTKPTSPKGRESGQANFTKQIVRLAHENPSYRDDLQPLLYAIAAKKKEDGDGSKGLTEQREFSKLLSMGPRFGTVSALTGTDKSKNKIRQSQLVADLHRLGYRKVSPMQGDWSLIPNESLHVQNVRPEDLFELGRKYDQEFVVFQNQPGVLGFYYLKGEPKARIIVDPKGDTAFRSVSDMTPYSRGKGLDLEWGLLWSKDFPWDGHAGLTRKQIRQMLKRDELSTSAI
jgi:hypothetical protein